MAKGPTYLRSLIPKLAREYPNEQQAIAALRRAMPDVNPEHVAQLFGEYKAQQALAPIEPGQDLRFTPSPSEILDQTVARGRPFMHEVLVVGRLRTGQLITKRIEVPVEKLTARWRAVRRAEEVAQGIISTEGPRDTDLVTVYAGIHVGAYRRRYA